MIEKFTYHEAILGLTHLVGWADGEDQGSELDVKVQMIITEGIVESTIDDFKSKLSELSDYDNLFNHCIATLETSSTDDQAKACAYMWQIALVATEGTTGDLDYDFDTWKTDSNKVDEEEKQWVDRAMNVLKINNSQLMAAFNQLPDIKRI